MYIQGFDGLRAIAMFLVFLTHKTEWGAATQIGFSGVWVFFLLSGFLITGQLRAARFHVEAGHTTLKRELVFFWLKRAMRIFPAYYVLIVLVTPFYLLTDRHVPGLPYYLTYLSNFYFQQHPPEFLTTWAHFWTLAVEEQFYVVFAPLMLLVPSRHATMACCLVVLASLVQRFGLAAMTVDAYVVYVDSLVNFGLLAVGALLFIHRDAVARAVGRAGLDRGLVGWLAAAGVIGVAPLARMVAGPNLVLLQCLYLVDVLAAILLLTNVFINQSSWLVRCLEWRPVARFGRISYGLYLYNDYVKNDIPERLLRAFAQHHWPAGESPAWVATLLREGSAGWMVMRGAGLVICLLLLVAVAQLSWRLVEKPSLRLRDLIVNRLSARSPKPHTTEIRGTVATATPRTP